MIPNPINQRSTGKQEEIPLVEWDDARLLKEFVVSENNEALRVIIERYGPMVMTLCRRATAQYVDAEDAFQATFLILVQQAKKIRKQKSLAGWLFKVARRTAVRARQRQRNKRELTVLSDHEPISSQNLFAEIAQEFEAEQIDIVLADLPEKYRDPLVMFHYQQMAVSEICEAMNSTQGRVEGLLKRGRSELKKRLQQAGITLSSFAIVTLLSQSSTKAGHTCPAGLIEQTVSTLTASAEPGTILPESIEHLTQQEWIPMLTKSAIAKSTLITTAALSIAMIAGSAFVVGEPPEGDTTITTQLTLAENKSAGSTSTGGEIATVNNGSSRQEAETAAKRPDAWKQKYRQALKDMTEFEFVDTPLEDATVLIGEQHGIDIRLDRLALEEAGVPVDEAVNLIISDVTLEDALELMFESMPIRDLDYVLEHGVMKITTREQAENLMEVRFYQIPARLLAASKNGEISGAADFATEKEELENDGSLPEVVPVEALSELIMTMTQGPWMMKDEHGGSIRIVGDTLVIRQNQRTHREIERLLDNMKNHFEKNGGSGSPSVSRDQTHSKVFIRKQQEKPRPPQFDSGGFF